MNKRAVVTAVFLVGCAHAQRSEPVSPPPQNRTTTTHTSVQPEPERLTMQLVGELRDCLVPTDGSIIVPLMQARPGAPYMLICENGANTLFACPASHPMIGLVREGQRPLNLHIDWETSDKPGDEDVVGGIVTVPVPPGTLVNLRYGCTPTTYPAL